jgi:hypothetical protein
MAKYKPLDFNALAINNLENTRIGNWIKRHKCKALKKNPASYVVHIEGALPNVEVKCLHCLKGLDATDYDLDDKRK